MMTRIDDRTPEQRQTHTLAWVGTDRFVSGWGEAAGLKSLVAWAFPLGKEKQVERWVRARGSVTRVRLVALDGYRPARSNLHIYVVDAAHPAWRFRA